MIPATPAHAASGTPLALLVVLAAAAIIPLILLVGTSFVKISVVLTVVRNAFGAAQIPGTLVITGLAAILSLHVMAPTLVAVADSAGPVLSRAMATDAADPHAFATLGEAWTAARAPIQRFLHANTSERNRTLFLDLATQSRAHQTAQPGVAMPAPVADDLSVLLPAFVISELTSAFAIGFLILLPFLVLELVIANVIAALNLQGLSTTTVALPFKLLLFVLADGWFLVTRALLLGYH